MSEKRLISRFVLTILIVASLFFSELGITPVHAASIVVNTNADELFANASCSLREAITNSNNNAATYPECGSGFDTDTITFAGNYTITLAGGQLPAVTSTIVINGNGAANTIIQANASPNTATYRVFLVNNGHLTLNSLTVRHGDCFGGCSGGGILKNSGTLIITNSTISGNSAGIDGGGIFNGVGYLTITNSTISGNNAGSDGGGIYNSSFLTVTNSTLSGNSATNGGGIRNHIGTLAMTNSTLSGNSATNGGGINNSSTMNISNSTFSENDTGYGGGIYNINSTGTVTNSTISGNEADENGGGIYNGSDSSLTVTNSTLSGNTANYYGGGISNFAILSIWSSTLNSNSAGTGGGIHNGSAMGIVNSTLSDNGAYDNGGGIYNAGNDARIYNSTIVFNKLGAAGTADDDAAGIYADLSVSLYNSLVAGNTIAPGIYRDCKGTIQSWGKNLFSDTTNCTINIASGSWGFYSLLNTLGPLQNNGGPTWTHALLPTSNAIDTGDNTVCANWPIYNIDQRGVARPQGSHCDVGAYELVPTFNSTAEQDGWILETFETSGRGGSKNDTAATIRLGDNATNKQYRGILSFDTSAIPENAIINKVTLKIKKAGVKGGGNPVQLFRGFMIDVKTGDFGAAALELGDFKAAGSLTLGPVRPPLVNGWYSLDLTAANLQINPTGNTQIRLRFKLDDNNNLIANYLTLYNGNATPENQPLLIVEYMLP